MCIFNSTGSLWVTSTSWFVADLYKQFKLQKGCHYLLKKKLLINCF
jgi:hypothetical protein